MFSGRGVGKMILKLMQGFFGTGSEPEDLTKKGMSGAIYFFFFFLLFQFTSPPCIVLSNFSFFSNLTGKRTKGTKRYMPQRNSVAYALLITLYRYTYTIQSHALLMLCFFLFGLNMLWKLSW